MPIETLLEQILEYLKEGKSTPKHPFRYVTLATSANNEVFQRMVVFRKIENNTITIYTDSRTPKVKQIQENSKASLLFWDYKRMTQIQLKGKITIDLENDHSIWNGLSEKAKEDYTARKTPGSNMLHEEDIQFFQDQNFFCKLHFHFTEIDYLQIGRPSHCRAKFVLTDNTWKGSYVIP